MATLVTTPKSNAAAVAQASVPRRVVGAQPLIPPSPVQGVGSQPLIPQPSPFPAPGTGQPTPPGQVTPFQTQPTSVTGNAQQSVYTPAGDEGNIVQSYLSQFLGSDSALMRDARTRGIEQAASAGLQNSTIAAGASQRAALDAVLPLVDQSMQTFNQRENRQWTSNENRLDRDQQITMSQVQDWLNNQSFMREFNANLSLMPIQNATQLMNTIAQQAIENPEVYTPDIISGMSEFFTTNYLDVLSRYFPSLYTRQGGA